MPVPAVLSVLDSTGATQKLLQGGAGSAGTPFFPAKGDVSGSILDANGIQETVANAFGNVAASTTDSVLVAAVTAKKIKVTSLVVSCGATATDATFNSKPVGAGTAISAKFPSGANGGFVLPYNPHGWFITNAGEGLSVTTGAGSITSVQVSYITE